MAALLEDAPQVQRAVVDFISAPTFASLAELQRHEEQLLHALEPPPARAEDRERVRSRAAGVPGVERLTDVDVTVVLQLSDGLGVNELLAARLLSELTLPDGAPPTPQARLHEAARLYNNLRDCCICALHSLLLHTAEAQLDLGDVEEEYRQFVQALLSASRGDKTTLIRLAEAVQKRAARCRTLLHADRAGTGAPGFTREFVTEQAAVEGQEVLLLAESLLFAAFLRQEPRLSPAEVGAITASLAEFSSNPGAGNRRTESQALATLFALLAALEHDKVSAHDCAVLQRDNPAFLPDRHDELSGLLRLALGLCCDAIDESVLRGACDDGAIGCLLNVVRSPAFQVKYMRDAKHPALPQLVHLLAELYEQGSDDLSFVYRELWDFVDYAVEDYLAERSPSMLMALLHLYKSLARSQANVVWSKLQTGNPGMNAPGDFLCAAMVCYCKLFAGDDFNAGLGRTRSLFRDENALPSSEVDMPSEDVDALVAYLELLQQLVEVAAPEVTVPRVQQLEMKCLEGQSIMLLLFTLLDFPVPPKLKAALFNVIGAFATEMASAVKIWTYLETAAVIHKAPAEVAAYAQDTPLHTLTSSSSRTDILYELNEIEARAETYVETLAFIRLVNRLLDFCESSNVGPAADAGAAVASVFLFVRDAVFLGIERRTYKDLREKWELMDACLVHFRLLMQLAQRTAASQAAQVWRAPGHELLLDFDNEGPVLRNTLNLVRGGSAHLADERSQPYGGALESCVDEAMCVLLVALGVDERSVTAQPAYGLAASRLDALLLKDRRRLMDLFSFVQYPYNRPTLTLQERVVRVINTMLLRNENLRAALDQTTSDCLRLCIVEALDRALNDIAASAGTARAIGRLLLDAVQQPSTPNLGNLGHLLLGFEPMPAGALVLSPAVEDSCLPLLLDAAAAPVDAAAVDVSEVLFCERVLHIVYTLCADPRTSAAATSYVSTNLGLSERVVAVTSGGAAISSTAAAHAALQHQRAWLLRLVSVVLHQPSQFGRSIDQHVALLRAVFARPSGGGDTLAPVLQLLQCVVAQSSTLPALDSAHQQIVHALGLANALTSDLLVEHGGLAVQTDRGEVALNLIALDALIRRRVAEQRLQVEPTFFAAVLRYALQLNNWRTEREARLHLLGAWSELVCLSVAEHLAALKLALHTPGAAADELVGVLLAALSHLPQADDSQAVMLLRASHMLLTQLRAQIDDEHVDPAFTGAFAGTLSPSVCHDILRSLLSGLLRTDRGVSTRQYLYAALLAYLQLCRVPTWGKSPAVLRALRTSAAVDWLAPSSSARRDLDAGNLAEFRRHAGLLISLLAREASGESEECRAQALALVQAILGLAEGAGTMLETFLFQSALPSTVAAMLERTPRSTLLLPTPALLRALSTVEAQLSFLLSVVRDTPGGAAHLVACGVITQLSGCQLIDALLEQRTEHSALAHEQLFLPALRLVTALLELLPDSRELELQAAAFVDAHRDVLLHALATRASTEDAGRMHEARLAARLLCHLCARDVGPKLARFDTALERLCWEFFADAGSPVSAAAWRVRSTLAGYVRKRVLCGQLVLQASSAQPRDGPPTLLLIAQLAQYAALSFTRALSRRHELVESLKETAGELMLVEGRNGDSSRSERAAELVAVDADARAALYGLENGLQVVHASLPSVKPLKLSDAEALARYLRAVLETLAPVKDGEGDLDLAFLNLLLRRVREDTDVA